MPNIAIHNDTHYDLTPWMLDYIQSEVLEYFGESVYTIRIQLGITRHAFNTKTREVRYAFFPSDFELGNASALIDDEEARGLFSHFDQGDADDGAIVASLEDELDLFDIDDDGRFERFDPEFESVSTADTEVVDEDVERG
jgi:hypothetical protein